MAQKYEFGRLGFGSNFSLVLMKPGAANAPPVVNASCSSLISEKTDFVLIGTPNITQGFRGETTTLQTEVRHQANESFLTLTITRPLTEACPFDGGFRKLDGVFQIKGTTGTPLSTTRVLILDLKSCNTFGCPCPGNKLCYIIKVSCWAAGTKEAIIESDGSAHLNATFSGILVSYRRNNLPLVQEVEETKLDIMTIQKPHDLEILVDGQKFQTQKGILAEQSDVFRAMFSNQMMETKTGVLEIEDMTADSVKALLEYFQNGQINDFKNQNIFFALFYAAHKYNIHLLKEALIELSVLMPIENCTLDHAIEFFSYAQYFQVKVLESRALQIFNRLKPELQESKSVDLFIKDHPHEVKKLLSILCTTFRNTRCTCDEQQPNSIPPIQDVDWNEQDGWY